MKNNLITLALFIIFIVGLGAYISISTFPSRSREEYYKKSYNESLNRENKKSVSPSPQTLEATPEAKTQIDESHYYVYVLGSNDRVMLICKLKSSDELHWNSTYAHWHDINGTEYEVGSNSNSTILGTEKKQTVQNGIIIPDLPDHQVKI